MRSRASASQFPPRRTACLWRCPRRRSCPCRKSLDSISGMRSADGAAHGLLGYVGGNDRRIPAAGSVDLVTPFRNLADLRRVLRGFFPLKERGRRSTGRTLRRPSSRRRRDTRYPDFVAIAVPVPAGAEVVSETVGVGRQPLGDGLPKLRVRIGDPSIMACRFLDEGSGLFD
jgi:hypothetical protein